MLLSFPPTSVPFIALPFGHLCDAGGFFSALRAQPWHSIAVNSIASYTFPDTYGSTPAQSAVSPILCPSPLSVSWFSWLPMDIYSLVSSSVPSLTLPSCSHTSLPTFLTTF